MSYSLTSNLFLHLVGGVANAAVRCPTDLAERNALIRATNDDNDVVDQLVKENRLPEADYIAERQLNVYLACEGSRSPAAGGRLIALGQIRFDRAWSNDTLSQEDARYEYEQAADLVERGLALTGGRQTIADRGATWCSLGQMRIFHGDFDRGLDALSRGWAALDGLDGLDGANAFQRCHKATELALANGPISPETTIDFVRLDYIFHRDRHHYVIDGLRYVYAFPRSDAYVATRLGDYALAVILIREDTLNYLGLGEPDEAKVANRLLSLMADLSSLRGKIPASDLEAECRWVLDTATTNRPDLLGRVMAESRVRDMCGMDTFREARERGITAEQWFAWQYADTAIERSAASLASALAFAEEQGLVTNPAVSRYLDIAVATAARQGDTMRLQEALAFAEWHGLWSATVLAARVDQVCALVEQKHPWRARAMFRGIRPHIDPTQGSPALRASLERLSDTLRDRYRYQEALAPNRLALQIARAIQDEDFIIVRLQREQAFLLRELRRFKDADALEREAAALDMGARGALAEALTRLGAIRLAEQVLLQALEDLHEGDADPALRALTLDRLARVQIELGDLSAAETNLERAQSLRMYKLNAQDPRRAESDLTSALLARARGDAALHARYLREGIEILRAAPGAAVVTFSRLLTLEGERLMARGQADEARALYGEAVRLIQESHGLKHPALVPPLLQLAEMALASGDRAVAGTILDRAHAIGLETPSARLPGMAGDVDRARLLAFKGRQDLAWAEVSNLVRWSQALVQNPFLTEREARAVLARTEPGLDLGLTLSAGLDEGTRGWELAVQWKGQVAELFSVNSRAPGASASGDAWGPTANARFLAKAAGADRVGFQLAVPPLHMALRGEELYQMIEHGGVGLALEPLSPEALCGALPAGAALIDLYRYRHDDLRTLSTESDEVYVAFVVRAGACDAVARVELGDAASLDERVARFNGLLGQPSAMSTAVDIAGRDLAERLWAPLSAHLAGVTDLIIAPDAGLSALSWAALPVAEDRYMIEDYSLRYLDSARELVSRAAEAEPAPTSVQAPDGLLLVGDIDYSSRGRSTAPREGSTRPSCLGGDFSPLPGTRQELDEIARAFEQSPLAQSGLTRLDAASATVDRLIKDLPQASMVHIASHAVTPSPACLNEEWLSARAHARQDWTSTYNPMAQSGLVLAGANAATVDLLEDGILSASELTGLDLRGVKLVVLSSCSSASGVPSAGEGLLGLRRALRLDGVHNLVLTTTPVDDALAAPLMGRLYAHLLASPEFDAASALRAAQLETLRAAREAGAATRPQAWAPFIVSGPPAVVTPSASD